MKNVLRIMIAMAVATMFAAGGFAGTAAAQDTNVIDDTDVADVDISTQATTQVVEQTAVAIGGDDAEAENEAEVESESEIEGSDYVIND